MSKKTPHEPDKLKGIAWPVCRHCGLVYLKNEATRRAVRGGCEKD